jgi:hypothetical protein
MHQIASRNAADTECISILITVNGKTALYLVLAIDGLIKRMGGMSRNDQQEELFVGRCDIVIFHKMRSLVTDGMLQVLGQQFKCHDIRGASEEISVLFNFKDTTSEGFSFLYGSESEGPPKDVREFVKAAVFLTQTWYEDCKRTAAKSGLTTDISAHHTSRAPRSPFFDRLRNWVRTRRPDLSERCVRALARVAKSAGGFTLSEDQIKIGDADVRLRAQIEHEESADTKFLIGIFVDVYVNGVLQPLTAGQVGVGSDRDDAIETAVSEWAMLVGQPLLGALGAKISQQPEDIGGFFVYHGFAGIRGPRTVTWPEEKQTRLVHRLESFIQGLEHYRGDLHSISLLVVVAGDGTTQGECRVDGAISPNLLKMVQSFPWAQDGVYMFKQFYALRRK